MAKKACPNCRKRFAYEMHSWVCPNCGTVITASMEDQTFSTDELQSEPEIEYKDAHTTECYEQKHDPSTGNAPCAGGVAKSAKRLGTSMIVAVITLVIISIVALMVVNTNRDVSYREPETTAVSSEEPETEEASNIEQETEPGTEPSSEIVITEIEIISAAVGEPIKMGGYDLTITEVFEPDWEELPAAEGWKYIAVSFEKTDGNGYEMYGFNGKDAYASLHDKTEGVSLMPLYESDIIDYEDEETDLYMSYDMISGLSYGNGTILFLVKETSSEFELSVFEGEGTSYSDYDICAERRIVIPVTVNEQEVSTQP